MSTFMPVYYVALYINTLNGASNSDCLGGVVYSSSIDVVYRETIQDASVSLYVREGREYPGVSMVWW